LGINFLPKTLFPYYSYDLLLGEANEKKVETILESIQNLFIADFVAILKKEEVGKNESNGEQMDPVKVTLSVEKNRDGKMGKTQVYFDYPMSKVLTQEEYQKEEGGIMEI
jgi:hypothetical protein